MCTRWGFEPPSALQGRQQADEGKERSKGKGKATAVAVEAIEDEDTDEPLEALEHLAENPFDPALQWLARRARPSSISSISSQSQEEPDFSWRTYFAREYTTRA